MYRMKQEVHYSFWIKPMRYKRLISMMLLVKRSEIVKIISASVARNFYIRASQKGWRTAEPSRIAAEHPLLFEQLVYRAVNEQEISVQRGAELLQRSFDEVISMCRLNEV